MLLFDLRGHGKRADFKVMDKPDFFCKYSYNKYAGQVLNKRHDQGSQKGKVFFCLLPLSRQ